MTTRLVIRANRLQRIGGDGIVAVSAIGALIERNVVHRWNMVGTSFNAGVWGFDTTDSVYQFNDVSDGQHGPLDAMAFDIDGLNQHLIFQYNFSHENSGGFLLLCNNSPPPQVGPVVFGPALANGGSIVRYNISQNDFAIGRGVIDAPNTCGSENNISIYNNTIFTKDPRVTLLIDNENSSSIDLANNIIVGPSPQAQIDDLNGTWSHNLYLDVTCSQRPADSHAVIADPLFVAPGTASSLQDAGGYRLRVGSPALGAGVLIPGNGGRDYFGNPVPADGPPNIGAYQGPGVAAPAPLLNLSPAALAPLC